MIVHFDENFPEQDAEIFYEVFYSYACVWQPFSFGTIMVENADLSVGVDDPTSLEKNVIAYPNPTSDATEISVTLGGPENGTIAVFDITGNMVLDPVSACFKPGTTAVKINTESLREGIYFYTFTSEKEILSGKLVIAR